MLRDASLIQETIRKLVKVIIPKHPIDVGKFSVRLLKDILVEHKVELELDFDDVVVYPGPQPRESADVELIKGNKIVGRISVKTAVSGDIRLTLRRLAEAIKRGESGIVVATALFYREDDVADTKLIIIYLPEELIRYYRVGDIYDIVLEKIEEKCNKERYIKMEFLAINEALEFERIKLSIEALEEAKRARKVAEEAKKLAEEARDEAKRAREVAEEAKKLAEEARDETREIKGIVMKLDKKLDRLLSRLEK